MYAEHDASSSSSTPDNSIVASSDVRSHGAASSSGHVPTDNWQQYNSEQMVSQYFQQTAPSEHEHGQNNWMSPNVGYGSTMQYQRERWLASRQPQFPDYDLSSLTPNTYISTSRMRDSERDQSSGQSFENRHVEEESRYNWANVWGSANNNAQNPSSGTLDRSSIFPESTRRNTVDNTWPSTQSPFTQPQPDGLATQSRSTFIPGSQLYGVETRYEGYEDHQ
jgi:hypothetical protein